MPIDESKLAESLSTVFGKPIEDVTAAMSGDDFLTTLADWDATKVATIKTEADNALKTKVVDAKKSKAAEIENLIKQKSGIALEKSGNELIDELIEKLKTPIDPSKIDYSKIPDDVVKKHPAFLQVEKLALTDDKLKELRGTIEAELVSSFQKKQTLSDVQSKALAYLTNANVVKAQNETVHANRLNAFLNSFSDYQYQTNGDDILVLDHDGKRVENKHGHPVKFQDFIKQNAESWFEFQQSQNRSSAGTNNTGGQSGETMVFKNSTDFYQKLREVANDPDKIKALSDAWKAQQETSK